MNPVPETPHDLPDPADEHIAHHPLTVSVPHVHVPKRSLWRRLLSSRFLFISIAVHLLFGLGATAYVVQTIYAKRKLNFTSAPPSPNPSQRQMEHKVNMAQKQKTMSAPAQPKRITSKATNVKVTLPEMPSMPAAAGPAMPGKMAGMGGVGVGLGPVGGGMSAGGGLGGGGVFSLPKIMADRCSPAARLSAMKQTGGKEPSEQAVVKALQFLKSKQNPDGSWGKDNKGAMTGLALLAFLGHCELRSPEFSPVTMKAIKCLVDEANKSGGKLNFGKGDHEKQPISVYNHAIAAYALGEACSMTKNMEIHASIEPALKAAITLIVNGQRDDGSWDYGYRKSGRPDLSVAGWHIQALKAAHYSGIDIPGVDKALDRAVDHVEKMQDAKTGNFGYTSPRDGNDASPDAKHYHRLAGVGVLALQIWKTGHQTEISRGIRAILDYPPVNYKDQHANLYAWYYETQACINAGGETWKKWNEMYQDQIVSNQSPDGSWPETGGKRDYQGNGKSGEWPIYRTALCTLMLEVYYRYLPSSKAAGGGGGGSLLDTLKKPQQ